MMRLHPQLKLYINIQKKNSSTETSWWFLHRFEGCILSFQILQYDSPGADRPALIASILAFASLIHNAADPCRSLVLLFLGFMDVASPISPPISSGGKDEEQTK